MFLRVTRHRTEFKPGSSSRDAVNGGNSKPLNMCPGDDRFESWLGYQLYG
jgi:hypothetical protein